GVDTKLNLLGQPVILTLSPDTLPPGDVGAPYTRTVLASGGTSPYTFTLADGTLPPGVTLASNGLLSGTPTVTGTFTFAVGATDSFPATGKKTYGGAINPAVVITTASLPSWTMNRPYIQTISGTGGTGAVHYTATGILPPGLTLSSQGVLSGTPTT